LEEDVAQMVKTVSEGQRLEQMVRIMATHFPDDAYEFGRSCATF